MERDNNNYDNKRKKKDLKMKKSSGECVGYRYAGIGVHGRSGLLSWLTGWLVILVVFVVHCNT